MSDASPELRLVTSSDAGLATLELISQARQHLAEAKTVPDLRRLMATAGAIEDAAKRAASLFNAERRALSIVEAATAAANDAAAIRIEAQAKAGELLKQMRESGERQQPGRPEQTSQAARFIGSDGSPLSLHALGLSRSESSRWQQLADVPEEVRQEYVEETKAAKGEVSTAGLLRHARGAEIASRDATVSDPAVGTGGRGSHAATVAGLVVSSAGEPGPENGRRELAGELSTLLNALPTYPPALVGALSEEDRARFHRTARRVVQWFGYLMTELRGPGADRSGSDFERVEIAYTAVHDLGAWCTGPAAVRPDALVEAVEEDERDQLLGAVRGLAGWLADVENELARSGASVEPGAEEDTQD